MARLPRHVSTDYVRWLPTGVYRSKRLSYRSGRSRSRPRARGDDQYRGGVGHSDGRAEDLTLRENDRFEEPLWKEETFWLTRALGEVELRGPKGLSDEHTELEVTSF
jgi:hypothetical protein